MSIVKEHRVLAVSNDINDDVAFSRKWSTYTETHTKKEITIANDVRRWNLIK